MAGRVKTWLIVRDAILLVFGMAGLSYEAIGAHPIQPEMLPVFLTCLGLPPFLRKGRHKYDDAEDR